MPYPPGRPYQLVQQYPNGRLKHYRYFSFFWWFPSSKTKRYWFFTTKGWHQ